MGPSPRFARAVAAERAALQRQRTRLAREANELRVALSRIEAGMAEIDALCARLDGLAPPGEDAEQEAPRGDAQAEGDGTPAAAGRSPTAPPRVPARTLRGPAIREVAVATLVAHGRDALHYRDWFALLEREGYAVAGKDPLAVFLTQLSRSPALAKGARPGVYALDPEAESRLRARRDALLDRLRGLAGEADFATLRGRRTQLTKEIGKVELALEEVARVHQNARRAA